jgi:hypothetical protein
MRSFLLVLAAVLVGACVPAGERALADHLAQVTEAGTSACAGLDWPATSSVVAALPDADRVVTVVHDEDLAVCTFGDVTRQRQAEEAAAAGDGSAAGRGRAEATAWAPDRAARHPAAVVIVMADPPELDADEGTTRGGREVEHGGWEPTDLGLREDHRGPFKTLRVGDHALITAANNPDSPDPTAGDLLDAVATDLGL